MISIYYPIKIVFISSLRIRYVAVIILLYAIVYKRFSPGFDVCAIKTGDKVGRRLAMYTGRMYTSNNAYIARFSRREMSNSRVSMFT